MDPLPGSLVAELDNLQRRMVFWACVPFANKRVDREFGKVERSSINEITLYRSIISPKSIPSLPPFSRTLPFISFVRARGVTSLFEIPTTTIPTIVAWLFPSRQDTYLFFPTLILVQTNRSRFQIVRPCFFDFFFFFLFENLEISTGNDSFFARDSIFNFRSFLEGFGATRNSSQANSPDSLEAKVLRDDRCILEVVRIELDYRCDAFSVELALTTPSVENPWR